MFKKIFGQFFNDSNDEKQSDPQTLKSQNPANKNGEMIKERKEEKIMIYESSSNEFVIMLDGGQEIQALSHEEWCQIISAESISGFSNERLQFSLLKGIPYDIRKDVWLILSNVKQLKQKNQETSNFNYSEKCRQEGRSDSIILKDLNRTFTEIPFFSDFDKHDKKYLGRERLMRVLRAYSHLDQEIGYTQGMNFIAGSLLMLMNPENEKELCVIDKDYEENIFWILVHIMKEKNWRILFKDGTPGIFLMMKKLEDKIKENLPEVYNHINELGLDCFSCFSQYFFTIMLYNAPKIVQKRILDIFLFEGEEVLYSMIIKMLTLCQDQILQKTDMQQMMEFCRKGILEECNKIFKEEKLKKNIDFKDLKFNIAKLQQYDLLSSQ